MTAAVDPSTGAESRSQRIPALDGIRALAVAGVVTYHVGADWLPGGFLGVDLFFVLSGFLITGILLDQTAHTGHIDFAEFFTRRARRLLPALYLMLIAICAWAFFIADPDVIGDLRGAALAALFYVANWFFILTGQSYFDAMQGPSPVEHTWSLAIEEQFYLLWPLLLLLLVRKVGPRVMAVLMVVAIAASAALMAFTYDAGDPSVAYFGTFTRIHELLIGSLVAWLVHRGLRMPDDARQTGWLALVGIVAMMGTIADDNDFYYRGGSVLFSLAVAWLLLAMTGDTTPRGTARVFSIRPLAWIGLISYGIYLWHWPLILWLTPERTRLEGVALAAVQIAATVAIAAVSHYAIERPIRRGTIRGFTLSPRRVAVIVPVAMLVMAGLIVGSTARAGDARTSQPVVPSALLGSTTPGAPVVMITGDSVPLKLMKVIAAQAEKRGWAVAPLAFGGCSLTGQFQVNADGEPFTWSQTCAEGYAGVQAETVATFAPEVVLWYSNRERQGVVVDGAVLAAGTPEHTAAIDAGLAAAYERSVSGGARLVIVVPTPKGPASKGDCAPGGAPSPECAADDEYYASFDRLAAAYERLAAAHPDQVSVVRLDDLLCPGGRDCPPVERGGEFVRPDGIHFGTEGAEWIVPIIFDRAGLAPNPSATP